MQHINTSLAYYLLPFLQQQDMCCHLFADNLLLAKNFITKQKLCIIIRYLDKKQYKRLLALKQRGYQLVYFMDDDLLDAKAFVGLPKDYRKRIYQKACQHKKFLTKQCHAFWVSTQYLLNKYHAHNPQLIAPQTSPSLQNNQATTWICYHGTASHQAELAWLSNVISGLHKTTQNSRFEVFGNHDVLKQYRHIDRVQVVHPMSWANYLHYTQSVQRDIGLVPLLPEPFNAARSMCKFFDLTRMGAVGIYSKVTPYKEFIRHEVDGFLLDNDPALWIKTIQYLIDNPNITQQMQQQAQLRLDKA